MFQQHILRLSFYFLISISGIMHGADYTGGSSALKSGFGYPTNTQGPDSFDPLGLRARKLSKDKEAMKPKMAVPDEEFDALLIQHKTDLLSKAEAERRVKKLIIEHPALKLIIRSIKEPVLFKNTKYPSRLLFVGPSGSGKTTAAKALACYCDAHCVFIKGSAVGNTYQNSGATLITDMFTGLLERPEQSFMVIIDEFMAVAKFVDDVKETQQNKTAMALWQALDDCTKKRHVCVIGTDNGDPEKLTKQLQTRFKNDIFVFRDTQRDDILQLMKENLGYFSDQDASSSSENRCSDTFLSTLAQSVTHLSLREVEDLIDKAKMVAVDETNNPNAKVTPEHLTRVFQAYQEPSWHQKVWNNRDKHLRNFGSARAVSLYLSASGLGLYHFTKEHKEWGIALGAAGMFLNHYWPRDEKEASDLPLFSTVSHLFAQRESQMQWQASYDQNKAQQTYMQDARKEDRADNKTWQEDQQERADWEKKYRLKESIKQAKLEEAYGKTRETPNALKAQIKYLQKELENLDLEEKILEPKLESWIDWIYRQLFGSKMAINQGN